MSNWFLNTFYVVATCRRGKLAAEEVVEENSRIVWEKAEAELLRLVQVIQEYIILSLSHGSMHAQEYRKSSRNITEGLMAEECSHSTLPTACSQVKIDGIRDELKKTTSNSTK